MQLSSDAGRVDLTYCTNIHPGESWADTRRALGEYLPLVRRRVCPTAPFGVGLRLSARAAEELDTDAAFGEFRDFLQEHSLYVFTMNGFPYGSFHQQRVKENVYLPDWRDQRRVRYSDRLASLLERLLPDGVDGSISTVPGAYREHIAGDAAASDSIARKLLQHAARLHDIRQRSGRLITLALEPEPSCMLETVDDALRFFEQHLLSRGALACFAGMTGLPHGLAEAALRRHLGLCLDACHMAVEFEDPVEAVRRVRSAGIRVAKLQLSAGLRAGEVDAVPDGAFAPYAEEVYLHQVVERSARGLRHIRDLPQALAGERGRGVPRPGREWRIHFHVPVWCPELGAFGTTQDYLARLLAMQREAPIATHLEVETYTWDVLPEQHRRMPLDAAIARELEWVLEKLQ
jgi:sugar phosphate isomerase/epimerase